MSRLILMINLASRLAPPLNLPVRPRVASLSVLYNPGASHACHRAAWHIGWTPCLGYLVFSNPGIIQKAQQRRGHGRQGLNGFFLLVSDNSVLAFPALKQPWLPKASSSSPKVPLPGRHISLPGIPCQGRLITSCRLGAGG